MTAVVPLGAVGGTGLPVLSAHSPPPSVLGELSSKLITRVLKVFRYIFVPLREVK